MRPHAWIEVDLKAILHNFNQIKLLMGEGVVTIPVVKANAYGHGLAEVGRALEQAGAQALAVTHVEEASILRRSGCKCEILLLTPPRGEDVQNAAEYSLSPCVMDREGVNALAEAAALCGKILRVHIKIDTGMGRLGVRPDGAVELARDVQRHTDLNLAGVFSHCAEGSNEAAVARQNKVFRRSIRDIELSGIDVPLKHLAASAAALSTPDARLNCVRIGTLLYGQYPTRALRLAYQDELSLQDTWRFCSRIIAIRSLPPGVSVGYGSEFQSQRVSRVAVVPVGAADGLGMEPVSLMRRGWIGAVKALTRSRLTLWARVRGEEAPIVGRIAMQMCSMDVTDIPEASVGDEVTLPVRRLAAAGSIPRMFIGA